MRPELTPWSPPPTQLALPDGEIHLWRADLDRIPPQQDFLSPDELTRANRLLLPEKRRRFASGRTLLRRILGRYLSSPPETLRFSYNPHGKPLLAACSLDFSLAHSGPLFLLAVGKDGPVGLDVEQIDPTLDWQKMAQHFFPPGEAAPLAMLPPWRQRRAFYRLWTRREAVLKGVGCGFSSPPASSSPWQIRSFPAGAEALAALATERPLRRLCRFDLLLLS